MLNFNTEHNFRNMYFIFINSVGFLYFKILTNYMVNMKIINNNNHNKYWNQYNSVTFPQRLNKYVTC